VDAAEAELRRRAVEGSEELIISMGKAVRDKRGKPMKKRVYSDNLLVAYLKAHRPEEYRENINVTVTSKFELSAKIDAAIKRLDQAAVEQRQSLPAPKVIDVEAVLVPASGEPDLNPLYRNPRRDRPG